MDQAELVQAMQLVLKRSGVESATISLVIVDDQEMQQLNRDFLEHDYSTDVLSFVYEAQPLDGEIIVCSDQAAARATEAGWSATDELLLYVIHGTLHLVGFLDDTDENRAAMREEESAVLRDLGRTPQPVDKAYRYLQDSSTSELP